MVLDEKQFPLSVEDEVALAILHPRTNSKVDDLVDLI